MNPDLHFWVLLGLPLTLAVVGWLLPAPRQVLGLLVAGGAAQAALAWALAARVWRDGPLLGAAGWFHLDALSALHLSALALVYLLSGLYAWVYFGVELAGGRLRRWHTRRLGALWFGALLAMTLVLLANNIGILWVGIEGTTLLTAFLICLHRGQESLEATWKYLLICSVGIAFAFMGTLLLGAAGQHWHLPAAELLKWTTLRAEAARLDPTLTRLAFLFLLVGYGTKTGLVPLHNWLPDAHSQSPAPVSALFSGFMLNTALYCLMRFLPLVEGATGHQGWSQRLLIFFGLLSVLVSAVFVLFQHDVKRLLAYSSVEHLGIMALGLGLGGLGVFAALFHLVNHALGKPLAFFAAGRVGQIYGTHDMSRLGGASHAAPWWGRALLGAVLALMGAAPFAFFLSKFLVLRAAAERGSWLVLGLLLAGTATVFVGALRHLINISWGEAKPTVQPEAAGWLERALILGLLGVLLVLGVWMPPALAAVLTQAAGIVEARP